MNERLDAVLCDGVARGAVAGVSAVVVDRDGVRYEGAFGVREVGGSPMTVDTVGAIYSMTKPVTGAAVMQLVEQGRLDLDAPASEVLPELTDLEVLEGFARDGAPRTRPAGRAVTLRHLLTHTSGFAYDIWNADLLRWYEYTRTPNLTTARKAALRTPLMFDPGTRWEYGTGIDWAGLMLEAVTGQTLGGHLADHLTGPLGMDDTAFTPTPSMESRRARMHTRGADGSLRVVQRRVGGGEDAEFELGGGGLHGTVGDYGRFLRMILNDGELDGVRVLAADTVRAMASNHIGDLRVRPLPSVVPRLSHDAEFFPGVPKSWGLTFQINEEPAPTGRSAGGLMWAGLSNCYFWIDRGRGVGGAFLSQLLPFCDPGALGLFDEFEAEVFSQL